MDSKHSKPEGGKFAAFFIPHDSMCWQSDSVNLPLAYIVMN